MTRSASTTTAVLACALAAPHALAQTYSVTDLGRIPGFGFSTVGRAINNHGQVVGSVQNAGTLAFSWTEATGIVALPAPPHPSGQYSSALDVNNLGHIVGTAGFDDGYNVFGWVYRRGQHTMLGTLPGQNGSRPLAINDLGEIVGIATAASGLGQRKWFYYSEATGMVESPPGWEFRDISNQGVVAGSFNGIAATLNLRTNEVRTFGTLPGSFSDGSFAQSINESGDVCGDSLNRTSSTTLYTGFVAGPEMPIFALGTTANGSRDEAWAINEFGQVCGESLFSSSSAGIAWVWTPGVGLTPIIDMVENPENYIYFGQANAINDHGMIVARGSKASGLDPSRRTFLLRPLVPVFDCPADLTTAASPMAPGFAVPDGTLTNEDFFYYLLQFNEQNLAAADLTTTAIPGGPGYGVPDGVLSNEDFFYYLAIFAAGC
ncbi:MAG: GC-type dockerin domain-anchored protein [Phycisphaerales bacterium]